MSIFPPDSTFGDPLPRPKADGHIWIGFCNIDGFPATSFQNPKVTELHFFISQMELDVFAGCKANLNWSKMPKGASLWEWFQSELPLHTISSHNIHDNFHHWQFSGTFLLGSGPITSSITTSGVDPSGLGRWSWFCLQGCTGHSICIISGYCPQKTEKAWLQAVYTLRINDTWSPWQLAKGRGKLRGCKGRQHRGRCSPQGTPGVIDAESVHCL